MKIMKTKRQLEWATSFFIGMGLMNILDIYKISQDQNALNYNWIMLGFSIIFLIICAILLFGKRKE